MLLRKVVVTLVLVNYFALGAGRTLRKSAVQNDTATTEVKRQSLPEWDVHFTNAPLLETDSLVQGPDADDMRALRKAMVGYENTKFNKAYQPDSAFTMDPLRRLTQNSGYPSRKFVRPTPQKEEDDNDDDDARVEDTANENGKEKEVQKRAVYIRGADHIKRSTARQHVKERGKGEGKKNVLAKKTGMISYPQSVRSPNEAHNKTEANEKEGEKKLDPLFPNPQPDLESKKLHLSAGHENSDATNSVPQGTNTYIPKTTEKIPNVMNFKQGNENAIEQGNTNVINGGSNLVHEDTNTDTAKTTESAQSAMNLNERNAILIEQGNESADLRVQEIQKNGLTHVATQHLFNGRGDPQDEVDSILQEERQTKLNEQMSRHVQNSTKPYGLPWYNGDQFNSNDKLTGFTKSINTPQEEHFQDNSLGNVNDAFKGKSIMPNTQAAYGVNVNGGDNLAHDAISAAMKINSYMTPATTPSQGSEGGKPQLRNDEGKQSNAQTNVEPEDKRLTSPVMPKETEGTGVTSSMEDKTESSDENIDTVGIPEDGSPAKSGNGKSSDTTNENTESTTGNRNANSNTQNKVTKQDTKHDLDNAQEDIQGSSNKKYKNNHNEDVDNNDKQMTSNNKSNEKVSTKEVQNEHKAMKGKDSDEPSNGIASQSEGSAMSADGQGNKFKLISSDRNGPRGEDSEGKEGKKGNAMTSQNAMSTENNNGHNKSNSETENVNTMPPQGDNMQEDDNRQTDKPKEFLKKTPNGKVEETNNDHGYVEKELGNPKSNQHVGDDKDKYGDKGLKEVMNKGMFAPSGFYVDNGKGTSKSSRNYGDNGKGTSDTNGSYENNRKATSYSNGNNGDNGKGTSSTNGNSGNNEKATSYANGNYGGNGKGTSDTNGSYGDNGKGTSSTNGNYGNNGKATSYANGNDGSNGKGTSDTNGSYGDNGKDTSSTNGNYGNNEKGTSYSNANDEGNAKGTLYANGFYGDNSKNTSDANGNYEKYEKGTPDTNKVNFEETSKNKNEPSRNDSSYVNGNTNIIGSEGTKIKNEPAVEDGTGTNKNPYTDSNTDQDSSEDTRKNKHEPSVKVVSSNTNKIDREEGRKNKDDQAVEDGTDTKEGPYTNNNNTNQDYREDTRKNKHEPSIKDSEGVKDTSYVSSNTNKIDSEGRNNKDDQAVDDGTNTKGRPYIKKPSYVEPSYIEPSIKDSEDVKDTSYVGSNTNKIDSEGRKNKNNQAVDDRNSTKGRPYTSSNTDHDDREDTTKNKQESVIKDSDDGTGTSYVSSNTNKIDREEEGKNKNDQAVEDRNSTKGRPYTSSDTDQDGREDTRKNKKESSTSIKVTHDGKGTFYVTSDTNKIDSEEERKNKNDQAVEDRNSTKGRPYTSSNTDQDGREDTSKSKPEPSTKDSDDGRGTSYTNSNANKTDSEEINKNRHDAPTEDVSGETETVNSTYEGKGRVKYVEEDMTNGSSSSNGASNEGKQERFTEAKKPSKENDKAENENDEQENHGKQVQQQEKTNLTEGNKKNDSGKMSDEELEKSSKVVLSQLKELQSLAQSSNPDPKKIDVNALHPGTVKILKKLGEVHEKRKSGKLDKDIRSVRGEKRGRSTNVRQSSTKRSRPGVIKKLVGKYITPCIKRQIDT